MADTSIEWTDATWNPVAGCTVLTAGCTNCYAMRMAARLDAMSALVAEHNLGADEKLAVGMKKMIVAAREKRVGASLRRRLTRYAGPSSERQKRW